MVTEQTLYGITDLDGRFDWKIADIQSRFRGALRKGPARPPASKAPEPKELEFCSYWWVQDVQSKLNPNMLRRAGGK